MIPTRVGNYRIVERVGDGGMGTVYRAVDEMLDREVALKIMRPDLSRQAALSARFRDEAIALARLHHPNIATVFGLERAGDDLALVLEFVRGETLDAAVQRAGRLEWRRAVAVCMDVLLALDHAHDHGVVHRDIKPANIMLGPGGVVKVMDFGIARIVGRSRQTRAGAAVGTPHYMSPEQLRGQEVDGRTDLYSLGAVLFELVTGQMPFDADSDYELMMKQLNEPPPLLRSLVAEVPDAVDSVIARAMAKHADQRYASASAMRDALRRCLHDVGTPAVRPVAATRLGDSGPGLPATQPDTAPPAAPAGAVPLTRLANPDSPFTPPAGLARTGIALPGMGWLGNWRMWTGLAATLVVVALAFRVFRTAPVVPGPVTLDTTAATVPARPVPGSLGDTSYRPVEPAGGAASISAPVVDVLSPVRGTTSAPPSSVADVRPRGKATRDPVLGTGPTTKRGVTPLQQPSDSTPVTPTRVEPTSADNTTPLAPSPAEDEATAIQSIAALVRDFTSSVSSRQAEHVAALLQLEGEVARRWYELMREGRLRMSVADAPDVDLAGSRATARFPADLNVRSAFGANRRHRVPFVAELSRNGGVWQIVSVRPVGTLSLD